jgi:hypothetical protein
MIVIQLTVFVLANILLVSKFMSLGLIYYFAFVICFYPTIFPHLRVKWQAIKNGGTPAKRSLARC